MSGLIGKFCSFNSIIKPVIDGPHAIYGEIVDVFQVEHPLSFQFIRGYDRSYHSVALIRLGTFAKDRLVEMPVVYLTIHNTEEQAKKYGETI